MKEIFLTGCAWIVIGFAVIMFGLSVKDPLISQEVAYNLFGFSVVAFALAILILK